MRRFTAISMVVAGSLLSWNSAGAQPPPPPERPVLPFEYAVKFICGGKGEAVSETESFAAGAYHTAINVHNPRGDARLAVKVVPARSEQPSSSTPFTFLSMRYDQALEFNCRSIERLMKVANMPIPAGFSGFFVIQSGGELDVVAVYTASQAPDRPVVVLHSERVPVRRVM